MELHNDVKVQLSAIECEDEGWESFFVTLHNAEKLCARSLGLSISEALKVNNDILNRHPLVSPYDHTRVVLSRGKCDYINANLVTVQPERNYILTQGPLPRTVSHFWAMVWEQKSQLIIMLNNLIEEGEVKCHRYWPLSASEELDCDDVQLVVQMTEEIKTCNYVLRRFQMTDKMTQEVRRVEQFHYTAWPDHGVLEPSDFLNFLRDVRQQGGLVDTGTSSVGPAVIHCSAGIGRSGSFCLADAAIYLMGRGKKVNVQELLLEMRRCRMSLVQNKEQLRFCYLSIVEGAQSLESFDLRKAQSNS